MTALAVFEDLASVHLDMIGLGPDETIRHVPTEPNTLVKMGGLLISNESVLA